MKLLENCSIDIDDENERIIVKGSIEELVTIIKSVHRSIFPNMDVDFLDNKIDELLGIELVYIRSYLSGDMDLKEFAGECILPQLTFCSVHRLSLVFCYDVFPPSIMLNYLSNDAFVVDHLVGDAVVGEKRFEEIKETFGKAIESFL